MGINYMIDRSGGGGGEDPREKIQGGPNPPQSLLHRVQLRHTIWWCPCVLRPTMRFRKPSEMRVSEMHAVLPQWRDGWKSGPGMSWLLPFPPNFWHMIIFLSHSVGDGNSKARRESVPEDLFPSTSSWINVTGQGSHFVFPPLHLPSVYSPVRTFCVPFATK